MQKGVSQVSAGRHTLAAFLRSRQDGQVLMSLSDTGVGLPEGKGDEIFEAFFTTKPQGSGMGLAISRSIVQSHGGRLWAISSGSCAIFHFTLPAEASAHQTA